MTELTTIVIAKAPVAGRVKTRLCPPCTPDEAAQLAEAALRDTFQLAFAAPGGRVLCALDGAAGPWLPAAASTVAQRGDGLDERLAAAFEDAAGPAVLIGMDTPQLAAPELRALGDPLRAGACDATIGMTEDGGYWGIGLLRSRPSYFHGVPMSQSDTGAKQLARLQEQGLRVQVVEARLRDVDYAADAVAVAELAPRSQFAAAVRAIKLPERLTQTALA